MSMTNNKDQWVIFLDIDGVLNTRETMMECFRRPASLHNYGPWLHPLDVNAVTRLNRITDATNARLVLSSTWRIGSEDEFLATIAWIAQQGVKAPILSRTPDGPFGAQERNRGRQIEAWLHEHYKIVERFVIIDDDSDMEPFESYLVQTDTWDGLTDDKAAEVIKFLQSNASKYELRKEDQ